MYAMINASNLIDYVPMVLMLAGCGIFGLYFLLSFLAASLLIYTQPCRALQ